MNNIEINKLKNYYFDTYTSIIFTLSLVSELCLFAQLIKTTVLMLQEEEI